jgi:hypothetical protein
MSVDASGKFAGSMVFSKWKGRNYVRQLVTPANPKSAKQTGIRCMLGYLAQTWATLGNLAKATWDEIAASRAISAFNAFSSVNLTRWQNGLAPAQANPAAETSTALTVSTQTLTGGSGCITLTLAASGTTDLAGFIIYRAAAEITVPSWTNAIAVIDASGAGTATYVDSPLDAGTYHYRVAAFNTDGKLGATHADGSAVAA